MYQFPLNASDWWSAKCNALVIRPVSEQRERLVIGKILHFPPLLTSQRYPPLAGKKQYPV